MEHSGNQAEAVVALLAVLGSRTAEEVLATETLVTAGSRARRHADVRVCVGSCSGVYMHD